MGMFDTMFDAKHNDWQTKAFGRSLEQWSVGDVIPGSHPLPFQVEVLGSDIEDDGDFVESFATVRGSVLAEVPAERDDSLPLLGFNGGWEPLNGEDDWEWGVEYGFDPRAVEPMRDRESAERFMANKPLWANPGHFIRNQVVRRRPAGSWLPVGGTE